MTFIHHARSQLAVEPQPPGGGISSGLVPQAFALLDWTMIVMLTAASGLAYDLAELGHVGSSVDRYVKLSLVAATLFSISAFARGIYVRSRLDQLALQIKEIALTWAVVFPLLVIIAPALGFADAPSRDIILLSFVVGITGISLARWGEQRALLRLLHPALVAKRQVVVIQQVELNSANLTQTIEACGAHLCKIIDLSARWKEFEFAECMREVINYVRQHSIDEILLAASWADTLLIERITEHLRVLPLPVTLLPDPVVSALLARPLVDLGPMRAVELQRAPLTIAQLGAKRMFDLTATVGLLVLLLPVSAVVAALIVIDSGGPIFFRQRRIGFNGSVFRIYKFRTMTVLEDGAVIQAQRNDARVTRVGRFLRRFSIDELPQLLNVLKGEMSLVGPRPHALAHDNEYSQLIAFYAARHKVKPGITGWAQVNGLRGATPQVHTMMMRVEHDLWYINGWSLWLDIKILLLTSLCMCRGRNAH
jgi:Undecaprenyl-phosphate glucose phosphotransferase